MAFMTKTNFGYSVLNGGILIGAGTLAVTAGTGARFPSAGNFPCVIWDAAYSNPQLDTSRELVLCTSRSTDTLTITRAQEGTSAKAWDSGSKVAMVISAALITQIETEIGLKANIASPTFTGTVTLPTVTIESWTTFTPTTGWNWELTQHGYYKDPFGVVRLKGHSVNSGAGASLYYSALPAGYRPEAELHISANTDGTITGQIRITTSGLIVVDYYSAYFRVSLDTVSFRAA